MIYACFPSLTWNWIVVEWNGEIGLNVILIRLINVAITTIIVIITITIIANAAFGIRFQPFN